MSTAERSLSKHQLWLRIKRHWQLYLIILVPFSMVIVFNYLPMYGITLAFKNFREIDGIIGSPWVNPIFKHFQTFFNSYYFGRLISNTLILSLYSLVAGFPFAIILAILINECRKKKFAKTVQMITYAPYFISTVVMVSIILLMFSQRTGIVNHMIASLGGKRINFMAAPKYFRHLYVWSGVWQGTGFSSVIYIAALAGVDSSLHEAAIVDGANRFQRVWHVDLPGIRPTIIILLILSTGSILSVGYEKVLLMQNSSNSVVSDIISTFVYQMGLINKDYGLSTAIGLFNSVINLILLLSVNFISRKYSDTSLL